MAKASTARDPTRTLHYSSCSGAYDSVKMGLSFPFEAMPELDAMIILDADRNVMAFCSQPETFVWRDNGQYRRYTPDLLVQFTDDRLEFREVKPEQRKNADPDLRGRKNRIEVECRRRGGGFAFWTREDIRRGPRLQNAKRLRASLAFLDERSVAAVRRVLLAEGLPTTLGALELALDGNRRLVGTALGLVMAGELTADLDQPLGPASIIARAA